MKALKIPDLLRLQYSLSFSLQGFLVVILLSFCYVLFSPENASAATFDVTSYGAKGDGTTDDSQAFLQAWADLCGDASGDPTLIIPSGMTFLISPLKFVGSSCKSPNINIKVKSDSI
ncbi:putative endo-polygalacturonase [Helianthus annuus]|nr:putative endo-polygalacturonase [Helianthus annuus]KAJ0714266.1 putative endo-polygalacturonase [Helianthus annuus]KAJ0714268.1 putative endo-polygalacturonase [Helianthus annuus]